MEGPIILNANDQRMAKKKNWRRDVHLITNHNVFSPWSNSYAHQFKGDVIEVSRNGRNQVLVPLKPKKIGKMGAFYNPN